jgi:hypothetical protein
LRKIRANTEEEMTDEQIMEAAHDANLGMWNGKEWIFFPAHQDRVMKFARAILQAASAEQQDAIVRGMGAQGGCDEKQVEAWARKIAAAELLTQGRTPLDAVRQAASTAPQQPVAHIVANDEFSGVKAASDAYHKLPDGAPLYAAPAD